MCQACLWRREWTSGSEVYEGEGVTFFQNVKDQDNRCWE